MIVKPEEFQNQMSRLFPTGMKFGEKRVRTVTFQVTEDCNLRCTYCYQINKSRHHMTFETAKKFVDLILEGETPYINHDNTTGLIIEFIGGEPFLEIDLIDKITDYLFGRMIARRDPWLEKTMVSLSTNGTLYFQPAVQSYVRKNINHLGMSVSIDGDKELHDSCRVFPDGSGSYDMAIKAAMHYRDEMHKELGSKMTLSPANVRYTAEAVETMIRQGYTQIHLNCVYEEGWKPEHATTLFRQLKILADYLFSKGLHDEIYIAMFDADNYSHMTDQETENWCGGNGDMIAVNWAGNIYPCLRYMESSLGCDAAPFVIGTVDTGIAACEADRCKVCTLQKITRQSQSTEKCLSCPIARGCGWCTAYNYQHFGDANHRATYICQMHQAEALANVYFWNRYYRAMGMPDKMPCRVPKEWAMKIITPEEWDELAWSEAAHGEAGEEIL
jgi:radical SAM peptide maturase (CXXX-repeat target family)